MKFSFSLCSIIFRNLNYFNDLDAVSGAVLKGHILALWSLQSLLIHLFSPQIRFPRIRFSIDSNLDLDKRPDNNFRIFDI